MNLTGNPKTRAIVTMTIVGVLAVAALIGCAATANMSAKPGVQLWGENCGRCHNLRTPASFSDKQWDVVVLHMRTRANLTAEEAQKIAEFLKAGN